MNRSARTCQHVGMLAATVFAFAIQQTAPVPPDPSDLVGTWVVDLRPTPESQPFYNQLFVIEGVEERSFKGRFYNSQIEGGKINPDWGKLHIGFLTRDASSTYFHSARLEEGVLRGTTYSPEREFLAVWSAKKE